MLNPKYALAPNQWRDLQEAARVLGLQVDLLPASTDEEIDAVFKSVARQRIAAVLQGADPFFDTRREKIVGLAARQGVPMMYHFREYPAANGLISYGIDILDVYRQIGIYTGRILKGLLCAGHVTA